MKYAYSSETESCVDGNNPVFRPPAANAAAAAAARRRRELSRSNVNVFQTTDYGFIDGEVPGQDPPMPMPIAPIPMPAPLLPRNGPGGEGRRISSSRSDVLSGEGFLNAFKHMLHE